jgi:type II secretory pathway component HofQ
MPRVARSLAAVTLAACASASPPPTSPTAEPHLAGIPTSPPAAAPPRTLANTETLASPEEASEATRASRPLARARGRARPLDLDVKDADLHDVCALIADVARVSIVVAVEAHPRVTVKMRAVPWDVALDTIVRSKGLVAEWEGALIVVRDPAKRR